MGLRRMKIQFNGIIEKRTKGCHVCGKRKSDSQFQTMKSYILPSGITKTFRVGHPEEVSDSDGAFLLSYKYLSPTGETKQVFEVV